MYLILTQFDISKFNSELIETNESANMLNGNAEMHTSVRTTNIYTIEPEFPKIDHKTPSIELLDTKTTTRKHPELNYKLRAFGAK
jgi:hypothetical protein